MKQSLTIVYNRRTHRFELRKATSFFTYTVLDSSERYTELFEKRKELANGGTN